VDHDHPLRPSVDEIKPRSRGGERTWDNQVAAHRRCNTLRGSRNAFTFYEHRGWKAVAVQASRIAMLSTRLIPAVPAAGGFFLRLFVRALTM
jgi:HNH endonuclease